MSLRALLLGLAGAATICGYTYFNDAVLRQTMLVGNSMPLSVYGTLIIFLLIANPLLKAIHAKLGKTGSIILYLAFLAATAGVSAGTYLLSNIEAGVLVSSSVLLALSIAALIAAIVLAVLAIRTGTRKTDDDPAPGPAPENPEAPATSGITPQATTWIYAAAAATLAILALILKLKAGLNVDILLRKELWAFLSGAAALFFAVYAIVGCPTLVGKPEKVALTGKQLALILCMTLAACVIPGSGLLRTFTAGLILPHKMAKTNPGWKEQGILDLAPEGMLADVEGQENEVLNAWLSGSPDGVPWAAWAGPILFWVPLLILLFICLTGFALVVHRQWADHEQLPYPIARFADALLPDEQGQRSGVLINRLFWIGLIAVCFLHFNNYLFQWFPRTLIQIPVYLDFTSLTQKGETFMKGGGWFMFKPTLYFTVIAFAYFLASDVSLSLGIGPIVMAWISGYLAINYGISLTGGSHFGARPASFLNFGAYLGLFIVLLYTGRQYYLHTAKQALGIKGTEKVDSASIWGLRIALLAGACFVAILTFRGFDWQLAIFYWVFVIVIFLGMGRIIAETGCFFIQPTCHASVIIVGIFGAQAIGPSAMVFAFLLSTVFLIDPREAFMPFMVNNLKLLDAKKLKLGPAAIACITALIIGFTVGLPIVLSTQYKMGGNLNDGWASNHVPKFAFEEGAQAKRKLDAQGLLESSETVAGFERFSSMAPDWQNLSVLALGVALVLGFSFCRLRFTGWPLHPILFVVWLSYPSKQFALSFLIGWFIKVVVTKYGGAKIYQSYKPLMFGLIAGDMLSGVMPSVIGLFYYLVTGDIPKTFRIMPG